MLHIFHRMIYDCIKCGVKKITKSTYYRTHNTGQCLKKHKPGNAESLFQTEHAEIWNGDELPDFGPEIASGGQANNVACCIVTIYILKALFFLQLSYNLSDNCICHFLRILKCIISAFNFVLGCPEKLQSIYEAFPLSLYLAKKILKIEDLFNKSVCCPNCSAIYKYEDAVH